MDDAAIRRLAAMLASQQGDHIEAHWINPLHEFLTAPTQQEAARVLSENPQLLDDKISRLIDRFIDDTRRTGDSSGRHRLIERRRLLRKASGSGGHGLAWLVAVLVVAAIAAVTFLAISYFRGSGTPSSVVASALGKYKIRVSWVDSAKEVTGFNVDNGCPVGACGGHGATLAKTTGGLTFDRLPGNPWHLPVLQGTGDHQRWAFRLVELRVRVHARPRYIRDPSLDANPYHPEIR